MTKQYAVVDMGSCEILSGWVDTEEEANTLAAECEQHESEPACKIITRETRNTDDE